jgi:hypothetical protein
MKLITYFAEFNEQYFHRRVAVRDIDKWARNVSDDYDRVCVMDWEDIEPGLLKHAEGNEIEI